MVLIAIGSHSKAAITLFKSMVLVVPTVVGAPYGRYFHADNKRPIRHCECAPQAAEQSATAPYERFQVDLT
jgi:hypothetical protein